MQSNLDNPFFAELEKLAVFDEPLAEDDGREPMNPDHSVQETQADADAAKEDTQQEKNKEREDKMDEIKERIEDAGDKEAAEMDALEEKVAAALPEYGALAKLYDLAQGGDEVSEDLFKRASEALDLALSGEQEYTEVMTKVAQDLFGSDENLDALFSGAGVSYVVEKLSNFQGNEELAKVAAAADAAGGFLSKVVDGITDFLSSVKNLDKLKTEREVLKKNLESAGPELMGEFDTNGVSPRYEELQGQVGDTGKRVGQLNDQIRGAHIGLGVAGGLAGAGAIYGGKKLYDTLHPEEQVAGEEDKLLISKEASGKLDTEKPNEEIGGMQTMSKQQYVRDFLKIAGAAALIELVNNERVDMGLRKEANDQFNEIASMGRKDMDAAFVKVAQQMYTEDHLHQIVAGQHTPELLDKVAFFLEANDMSTDELNKIAGASGVAAKGVAGALTDAASNIAPTIEEDKKKAEGAGREYIGVVKGSGKDGGGTGTPGGQIIGNSMAGYSVINQPAKYDIEQTAAMLEEAVLAKQAAAETYQRADAFIKQYAPIMRK